MPHYREIKISGR